MLSIQNLHVEFGARTLFRDLSFAVMPKERISFAGHNGAGKSTLMKCIAGILEPNAGEISTPKGFRVGYLPQEGIHIQGISLWKETESAFSEALDIQKQIDRMSSELETLDPRSAPYAELLDRIGSLELQMDSFDPSRMKPKIESVLTGLGFKRSDFDRDCSEFSGGWQMRIAMAKLFLQEPDLLLLDEPTNHLDIDSQSWVEQYLHNYSGAIILISHDLSLLDMLTTRTIAFHHGRAEEYSGNYSFYIKESALRKETLLKQYKAQQREIEKTEAFINRFRAQANKASQVQSRIKQLEKIERIVIEEDDAVMNFKFPEPPPSGQTVSTLEDVTKRYGELTIFGNYNVSIERGERIAIVGPNGAGKSTFCRMITGQEEPTSGEHRFGHKVAVSFFSQNHADELDGDKTILETVEATASRENRPIVRNILGCFLFRGDDVFKKVKILSGGERSRVALVSMLVRPANFLILDEPTNHLDVQSQEILQKALDEYTGTYLIVSHNRAFLDSIVTKTIEFRPGKDPQIYHGNVSYYLEKKTQDEASQTPLQKSSSSSEKDKSINRKEQRRLEAAKREKRSKVLKPLQSELETLEAQIAEFEAAQTTFTDHMAKPEIAGDADKLQEASHAYANLSDKLEKAYSRWSELSDQIEMLEKELI